MAVKSILALDLASKTGFAFWREGAPVIHGCKKIGSPGCGDGKFFAAFDLWLSDMITVHSPESCVFEAPFMAATRNLNTARRLIGLATITDLICEKRQIPVVLEVNVSSVKKHFSGSGRADKGDMVFRARQLGFKPQDDNAADALGVLSLALSKILGADIADLNREAAE